MTKKERDELEKRERKRNDLISYVSLSTNLAPIKITKSSKCFIESV